MRTYGNSYAAAAAEPSGYKSLDAKNDDLYLTSAYTDDTLDGGASGTAEIPASGLLVLDYRPVQSTFSMTIGGAPASVVSAPIPPPNAGSVSVNWVNGFLEFHADDIDLVTPVAVVATYKHYGTVIDAHTFNRLQVALLDALEGGGGGGTVAAGDITAGTFDTDVLIQDASLSDNVPLRDASTNTFSGSLVAINITSFGSFTGSGTGLTNLPAANLTGTLPAISGANLTALNASNLASGTVPDARFPATLPAVDGFNLTNIRANNLVGTLPALNASALIYLNATNITTGTINSAFLPTIPDAKLSSNIPLENAANTFTAKQTLGAGFRVAGSSNNIDITGGFSSTQQMIIQGTESGKGTAVSVIPKGTSTSYSKFSFFGTDFTADTTNFTLFDLGYGNGTEVLLNSRSGGSATVKPMKFQINGTTQLEINTGSVQLTGNVGFYGTTPIAKPDVDLGAAGNAQLYAICDALVALGLITYSNP